MGEDREGAAAEKEVGAPSAFHRDAAVVQPKRVLERPVVPLHNNASESDIREYVKKRKISGSTRSDSGRRCRDTFASLKKTCRKLGVRFWDYLNDRIRGLGKIARLAALIHQRATEGQPAAGEAAPA